MLNVADKARLAELMAPSDSAKAQALLAAAAGRSGRPDWSKWLRQRAELLVDRRTDFRACFQTGRVNGFAGGLGLSGSNEQRIITAPRNSDCRRSRNVWSGAGRRSIRSHRPRRARRSNWALDLGNGPRDKEVTLAVQILSKLAILAGLSASWA